MTTGDEITISGRECEDSDTVAAISTPSGRGGIGMVRISGPRSLDILKKIFFVQKGRGTGRTYFTPRKKFSPRRIYHGFIRDPADGRVLDEVLSVYMKAPFSYTREDIVEIHTHGGFVAAGAVLELVAATGASFAEPGEFTKRAFLNGRIDLTQAEAVIDIINAKNSDSLAVAATHAAGRFRDAVESLCDGIVSFMGGLEASMDFFHEDEAHLAPDANLSDLHAIVSSIAEITASYETGRIFREGLVLAVAGRPNVGKSSLFNIIAGKDRAIVTEHPGTTRDILEFPMDIDCLPVILTDTAGMRRTDDPVESVGIDRTRRHLADADMVIMVLDGSVPVSEADVAVYDSIKAKKHVIAVNKTDLPAVAGFPEKLDFARVDAVRISALHNRGISELKEAVGRELESFLGRTTDTVVSNIRQKKELENALASLKKAQGILESQGLPEAAIIDLKEALGFLENITGEKITDEDVLDRIFQDFCVGK